MSKAAAEYQKHVTGVDHTLNANEKSFAIQEYIEAYSQPSSSAL